MRQAICDFEPRLLARHVKVQVTVDRARIDASQRARVRDRGELWAQPVPLELYLRTELDLETGARYRVARGGTDGAQLMDPRLLATTTASCCTCARSAAEFARGVSRRSPARLGLRGHRVRRPLRRAAARGLRVPRRARPAQARRGVPALHRSTCSRSSTRTTWRRCRRWRWCSFEPDLAEAGAGARVSGAARHACCERDSRRGRADAVRIPHRARRDAVADRDGRGRRTSPTRRELAGDRAAARPRAVKAALRLRLRATAGADVRPARRSTG